MKAAEYYAGRDLKYPTKPKRPTTWANANSKELREYADRLEVYEKAMETFNSEMADYKAVIQARKSELVNDLAKEYGLTYTQAQILFIKAWEDGHSSGIEQVIDIFDELYDLVHRFNQAY